jgi:hypothetical protein
MRNISCSAMLARQENGAPDAVACLAPDPAEWPARPMREAIP